MMLSNFFTRRVALFGCSFVFLSLSTAAFAERTLTLPIFQRRTMMQRISPFTDIGMFFEYVVYVKNVSSSVAQTGSLRVERGTTAHGFCELEIPHTAKLISQTGAVVNIGALSNATLPKIVEWKVAPNETAKIVFQVFFSSTFPTNSCVDAEVVANLSMTVNEDKGAVSATLTPVIGPSGLENNMERSGVPLLINGGKPF